MYCLVILIVTGVYLTFFFVPATKEVIYDGAYAPLRGVEMSQAYASTLDISFEVRAGMVMRQMHHWAALVFVAAIVVHLCRVFFTGAFRRPRELNWIVGVTLLVLAIANGFFGYSLLDDLLSGTGVRVAYSIALSIPAGRHVAGVPVLRRRVPQHRVHHPVLRPPRADRARPDHRPAHRPPGHGVAPEAHPVQGPRSRPRTTSSGPGCGRSTRPSRRGCSCWWRRCWPSSGAWPRSTPSGSTGPYKATQAAAATSGSQPDWYMGWVDGALRIMPALGDPRLRPHHRQPLLPGRAHARDHLRRPLPVAVPRAPLHPATRSPTTSSTGPATHPCAPPWGPPPWPSTASCCWPGATTSWPASSASPPRTSPSPSGC